MSTSGSTGGVLSIASGVACASPCNEAVSIYNSSASTSESVFADFGRGSLFDGAFRLGVSSVHVNCEGSAPRHKITRVFLKKYASFLFSVDIHIGGRGLTASFRHPLIHTYISAVTYTHTYLYYIYFNSCFCFCIVNK